MEERLASARPARFGAFEVDLRAGELRRRGLRIKLQEQPLQILAMLLQRPGEVITREELQKKLWPADTFVDFDHGLNKAITKIREALGDSADSPRFIETLPRRGYRFIAPVEDIGSRATPTGEPPVTSSRRLARALFLVLQVSYLVMYGAAFHYLAGIQRISMFLPLPNVAVVVQLCALTGAALHLYLLSAVAFDYADSGRLFQRLFPGILLVDLLWSASPLFLYPRFGEFILLFVAGLAFLPFSQRSLLRAAYSPAGGRLAVSRRDG